MRKKKMSICDLSSTNVLPTKTRSGAFEKKRKVTILRAVRMADFIVVRYSDGVLRITHASKIPGAELVPRVLCKGRKGACRMIVSIMEGKVKF